jgi:hypothetical protein
MPQITESTVAGAPADEVWALLRDFAAIGDWHPAQDRLHLRRSRRRAARPLLHLHHYR